MAWSTQYHDGTAPSQFKPLTPEARLHLEKAMEEAYGKIENPNEVMQEAIKQIRLPDRTDASILTALEIMDRKCDDPDCARNVEKLDGLQCMLDLLKSHPTGNIHVRALEILALVLSNNQNIQEAAVRRGAMEIFLELTKDGVRGSEERSKALRALVSLVRPIKAFQEKLLRDLGGLEVVLDCLSLAEDPKTREKAASFLRSLLAEGCLQGEDVCLLAPAVSALFRDLAGQGIQYRETISACVLELARDFPDQRPEELEALTQARLAQLESEPEPDTENELANLKELACLISGGDP